MAQEELNETLKTQLREQSETFYTRLQSERAQQKKKFDWVITRNMELMNQLLDQQEQDQAKPWWQKINLNLSITKKSEPESNKESYFYPSWATEDQSIPWKVVERYSRDKKRWEVVKDDKSPSKIKSRFGKKTKIGP